MILRKFKLSSRLIVTLLFLTSISTITTTLFSIYYFSDKIWLEAQANMSKNIQVAHLIYQNKQKDTAQTASALVNSRTLSILLRFKLHNKIQPYIANFIKTHPHYAVTIYGSNYNLIGHAANNDLTSPDLFSVPRQLFEQATTQPEEPLIDLMLAQVEKQTWLYITAIATLYNKDKKTNQPTNLLGFAIVRYALSGNDLLIKEIQDLLGVQAAVYDTHKALSYTDAPPPNLSVDATQALFEQKTSRYDEFSMVRDGQLASYKTLLNRQQQPLAVLAVSESSNKYIDVIYAAITNLVSIMLLCILAALGLSYFLSRGLLMPVQELLHGVNTVRQGNLSHEIKQFSNKDELGELASAFNQMRVSLKQTYESLRESEAYNRTLVNESPLGLVLTDLNLCIVDSNAAFCRILGYDFDELRDVCLYDLTPLKYTELDKVQYQGLQNRERYGPYEKEFIHKNGDIISVRLSGLVIEKNKDRLVWSSVEDITAQKKAVEADKRREAAEAANHAKSQFIANMSHELRTPLNAIIGYSEMLKEDLVEIDPDYLTDLDKILSSARHLLGMINDILDISKIESGKMDLYTEDFDINQLLHEVVITAEPLIEKNNNTLVLDFESNLGQMHTDFTKVKQIILNLLSNAAKFSENTKIVLTVKITEVVQNDAVTPAESWALMTVKDHGIGMTPEQLSRLFQAFSQAETSTTRKYGGTGLGLAISRRFALMMGGDIKVESEVGVGSAFTLSVPCVISKEKEYA